MVYLDDLDRARSFLENLTTNPTLRQYVWRLVINYIRSRESWEEVLNNFASLLSDLHLLEYRSLSALTMDLTTLDSRFTSVQSFTLRHSALKSFHEVIQILHRLPNLQELCVDAPSWVPGLGDNKWEPLDLRVLDIKENIGRFGTADVLYWAWESGSASKLTTLSCSIDTDVFTLGRALEACAQTFQKVTLHANGPLRELESGRLRGLPSIKHHSALRHLSLYTDRLDVESLHYILRWLSVHTTRSFTSFYLILLGPFECLFSPEYEEGWKILDTTLTSPDFPELSRVQISVYLHLCQELNNIRESFERNLPTLYRRGVTWVERGDAHLVLQYDPLRKSQDTVFYET